LIELRTGVWNPTSYTLTDETKKGYLLPLVNALDGTRSPAEIAHKLNIPRTEMESLIDHLQQIGAIETTPSTAFDLYLEQLSPALHTADMYKTKKQKLPIILFGDEELIAYSCH
jgi:hypothetical protein